MRVANSREALGHGEDGEVGGVAVRDLAPVEGCGNASVGERADGVGRAGGAILGVLVVVEEDAVPLLFPPLGTGDVRPAAFDGARERYGGAAHFGEGPIGLDADVDVHAAGTTGFGPAVEAHVGKEGFDFERDRADLFPGNAGPGIEV